MTLIEGTIQDTQVQVPPVTVKLEAQDIDKALEASENIRKGIS